MGLCLADRVWWGCLWLDLAGLAGLVGWLVGLVCCFGLVVVDWSDVVSADFDWWSLVSVVLVCCFSSIFVGPFRVIGSVGRSG